MLPPGGIIILSDDHPVYLSFLFIVQNDTQFFDYLLNYLLFMHLFIWFLHLEICF